MWRVVLVVLGLSLTNQHASAQPPPISTQVNEAYTRGEAYYKAGEYIAAAESFEQAYALDSDPATLFNVAQAYRFGNACAKAATYYRKFLDAVATAPNVDKVREYIAEQDRCVKRQLPTNPGRPPDPPSTADRGRGRRFAGIATGAVGLVAIGAGVFFTLEVSDIERERDKRCTQASPCELADLVAIDRRAERVQQKQIISYAVGGVAIAGGIALYLLGSTARTNNIAIVPSRNSGLVVGTFQF